MKHVIDLTKIKLIICYVELIACFTAKACHVGFVPERLFLNRALSLRFAVPPLSFVASCCFAKCQTGALPHPRPRHTPPHTRCTQPHAAMSDDPFDMLRPMPPKVAPERAAPEESEASLDAFLQLGTPPAAAPAPSCTPDGVAMPKAGISVDALSEEAVVEKINAAVGARSPAAPSTDPLCFLPSPATCRLPRCVSSRIRAYS